MLALPRPHLDAPALFALVEDDREGLEQLLPWVSETKKAEDEEGILKRVLAHFGTGGSLNLVIHYNGFPAGMIGFNSFHTVNRSADIGYWLGRDFRGKGIVCRAVAGLCEIGFEEYGLNKIMIRAATDNQSSNAVAERAGFHLDGTLRCDELLIDGFHDSNEWSLLKSEWKSKND